MTLIASDPEGIGNSMFTKKITLKEIKEIHNLFLGINSFNEFVSYLKNLAERKKLSLIIKDNKLAINLSIDYLFKETSIDIILSPEKKNSDEVIKDLCEEVSSLKNENKELKNEIKNLNKEIKCLKEEITEIKKIIEPLDKKYQEKLKNNKPVLMKENEFGFIHLAIKSRMNKEVKELKKLYQATVDGDTAPLFHKKCDGIPNTLVIIKSAGNRRFGGFTSQTWQSDSKGKFIDDKNAFLFSLDKQKIYSYKNDNKAIFNYKDYGPTFGNEFTLFICSNCIQEKYSYTSESHSSSSYNFDGDNNALSESNGNGFNVVEYEVFEIIFA
jgi:archaellum component FlaC